MNLSPMKHVMLDLETLGHSAGCVILSIGAVRFNPETGELGDKFYTEISTKSCQKKGMRIDAETLVWWASQSEEARAVFKGDADLVASLYNLSEFCKGEPVTWAHGSNFDFPIIEHAFRVCYVPIPWPYRNVRDTRTLFSLTGTRVVHLVGTHHNALDDAVTQAKAVCEAYQKIQAGELVVSYA